MEKEDIKKRLEQIKLEQELFSRSRKIVDNLIKSILEKK
jgi:hypothetical protein